MTKRVTFARIEPARPADLDHLVVDVESTGADAGSTQEIQEFAAPAAHVQHVARTGEVGDVIGEPLTDVVLGTAEAVLESRS